MDLNLKTALHQSRHWRLNTIILKDEEFTSNFSTEQTCKAYARGLIISYSATKKRQRLEKQKSLESELMDKEKAYTASPSTSLWQVITTLRSALNCLLTRDAEKKMKYTRQRFYEHGDKVGKCLLYYIKKRAESNTIAAVSNEKAMRYTRIN